MNSYMQQLANDIGLSPSLSLDDVDDLALPDPSDMLLTVGDDCLMDDFPSSPDVTSPSDCLLPVDVMSELSASPSMSLTSDMSLETFHQLEASLEATDPNNNGNLGEEPEAQKENEGVRGRGGEKYSLRPRVSKRRAEVMEIVIGRRRAPGVENNAQGKREGKMSGGRAKQRPPPLSKYRRKTANARERDRMREINAAFELLRRAVPVTASIPSPEGSPSPCADYSPGGGSEKLTKITTLRLAMQYITTLSQLLQTAPPADHSQQQHQPMSVAGYPIPMTQSASQQQGYALAP